MAVFIRIRHRSDLNYSEITILVLNQLLQLCTQARTVWSDPVIRPVSVRSVNLLPRW